MQIKNASIQVLRQLKYLIEQLNDKQYAEKSQLLLGSSIGKHTRHILEFYDIFLHSYYTGIVNYDNRDHDTLYEEDRQVSIEKIAELCEGLHKLDKDFSIVLVASYSESNMELSNMQSSVLRELAYNLEHAIHHMAFIKMAVKNQYPRIDIDDSFGVAFSTRYYENQKK